MLSNPCHLSQDKQNTVDQLTSPRYNSSLRLAASVPDDVTSILHPAWDKKRLDILFPTRYMRANAICITEIDSVHDMRAVL